jgi:hypothetical protein
MIERCAIACWNHSWAALARNRADWITADRDQRDALDVEESLPVGVAGIPIGDPPIDSELKDDRKEQVVTFEMSSDMGKPPLGRCFTIDQRGVPLTNVSETP